MIKSNSNTVISQLVRFRLLGQRGTGQAGLETVSRSSGCGPVWKKHSLQVTMAGGPTGFMDAIKSLDRPERYERLGAAHPAPEEFRSMEKFQAPPRFHEQPAYSRISDTYAGGGHPESRWDVCHIREAVLAYIQRSLWPGICEKDIPHVPIDDM